MEMMIDLETLSTKVNAVIVECGWCLFDLEPSFIHSSGSLCLSVEEQLEMGRDINYDTLKWWLMQSEEARKKLCAPSDIYSVKEFLVYLHDAFNWKADIEGVWSHGLTFDLPILSHLFAQMKMKEPWHYKTPRDTRTMLWLSPVDFVPATIKHSAEADAIAQAMTMQNSWKKLKGLED